MVIFGEMLVMVWSQNAEGFHANLSDVERVPVIIARSRRIWAYGIRALSQWQCPSSGCFTNFWCF